MIKNWLLLIGAICCATLSATAQNTIVDSIRVDGISRSYRLYIPGTVNANLRPLILNMHGLGSNALEQQYYGNFMPLADTAGFYIVMPQGTSFSGTAFWNVGFPGTPQVNDVKFLSVLIDTLVKRYPLDKSRVYATGMSNGGYMAHLLGIQLNNKIAAVASVAGSIVPDVYAANPIPGRTVPALQVHGTSDPTVPYNGFAYGIAVDTLMRFWIKNNACNATPVQTAVPNINTTDGCTADHFVWSGGRHGATVELYRINGGAHSWPGAVAVLGVTNQDFSASAEIWRFFRQYRLDQFTAVAEKTAPLLHFSLSPNPAKDRLHISADASGNATISDLWGKVMLRSASKDVDISLLPSGTYLLEYNSGDAKAVARFVKE